mmetsp:Transcript_23300/g.36157  ORF Transcript_23300/g.36157 Transcript_23300/m.36157 type:complete len:236 (-) Transcript_23300:138-845(-)
MAAASSSARIRRRRFPVHAECESQSVRRLARAWCATVSVVAAAAYSAAGYSAITASRSFRASVSASIFNCAARTRTSLPSTLDPADARSSQKRRYARVSASSLSTSASAADSILPMQSAHVAPGRIRPSAAPVRKSSRRSSSQIGSCSWAPSRRTRPWHPPPAPPDIILSGHSSPGDRVGESSSSTTMKPSECARRRVPSPPHKDKSSSRRSDRVPTPPQPQRMHVLGARRCSAC